MMHPFLTLDGGTVRGPVENQGNRPLDKAGVLLAGKVKLEMRGNHSMTDSQMPLVSVIVPVYGVEQYLSRCVESILHQTYKNIEVILVDDGSPDKCPELCDLFAKQDSRITVFHKTNGGPSSARNYGFKNSRGEYIAYIDSDDYVSPLYIERLYSMLAGQGADISSVAAKPIGLEGCSGGKKDFSVTVLTGRLSCRELFTTQRVTTMPWGKLYKRNVLGGGIGFPEGRKFEDRATVCKYLYAAGTVVTTDEKLYYVNTTNETSICHTKSFKNLDDSLWAAFERSRFFAAQNETELSRFAWNFTGGDMINTLLAYPLYKKQWRHYIREFFNEADAGTCLKLKLRLAYYAPKLYKSMREGRRRSPQA